MAKSETVYKPRKNFVKVQGRLLYTQEQMRAFQNELDARPIKGDNRGWWLSHQLETGELSSFTIYARRNVSQEEIMQEAFDKCNMGGKKEYQFKLEIQSQEEIWFEDLPYEVQQKFGACYKTTLSYLPETIKCWKRWGRRSYDMLVPNGMELDRGRRIQWEKDQYFEDWQIAKDTFFGNDSEALRLRKEAIAKEKETIRLAKEQKSREIRQIHQAEVDEYNEKYRLYTGETKEEYYLHPKLGECYITLYLTPALYTEESLREIKIFIDRQIEEAQKKKKAEEESKMWQEEISVQLNEKPENGGKSLVERAIDLGYRFVYHQEELSIYHGDDYVKSVQYSDNARKLINKFVTQKETEVQKQKEEEKQRREYEQQKAEAKTLGLPTGVQVWHRVGAGTMCGEGWVIRSDGTFREPDTFIPKKQSSSDGFKCWEQILKGEVVLSWKKGNVTSDHDFEVIYMPDDGLSEKQKEQILKIEEQIQEEWKDRRGLSSGEPSPSVWYGWDICNRETPLLREEEMRVFQPDTPQQNLAKNAQQQTSEAKPADAADLAALVRHFGGRVKK